VKCIHCGSDTKYADRRKNDRRCGACKHPFAFEPKADRLTITDPFFQRAIKGVSNDSVVFFTERQLWYEFNRRRQRRGFWRRPWGWVALLSGPGGLVTAVASGSPLPLVVGAGGVAVAGMMSYRAGRRGPRPAWYPRLSFDLFRNRYLARWIAIHGPIERLLPPPAPQTDRPPPATAPDLTSYSFDRALVTDRAETAAMLVANNFHFENNCAILSVDGYPYEIAGTVMEMLRRNPALRVFALHDASPDGCALARALREEGWFPDPSVQVFDLGLRPAQAQRMGTMLSRQQRPSLTEEQRRSLLPDEMQWLSGGNVAELAAMRPARLMRAAYQGFARAGQIGAGDVADSGLFIWSSDDRADIHASDSFG
jgi:hypothetical protein